MNNSTIQNTIQEHMKTLPHDVQEAIHGSSWERKILNIGRKYGLHVDQLEILQTELSLAVLGLTGRDEFVRETMREAKIDRQTMDLIIVDINHEIFEPIRDHLRKTRQQDEEREVIENESLASGLHHDEEETLRRHGVSFDLNEEQIVKESKPFSEKVEEKQQSPSESVLSTPLRLPNKNGAQSFEDSIQTRVRGHEGEKKTEEQGLGEEETGEVESTAFQVVPTNEELPSKQTEQNQKIITASRGTLYQGSDPYREPI